MSNLPKPNLHLTDAERRRILRVLRPFAKMAPAMKRDGSKPSDNIISLWSSDPKDSFELTYGPIFAVARLYRELGGR